MAAPTPPAMPPGPAPAGAEAEAPPRRGFEVLRRGLPPAEDKPPAPSTGPRRSGPAVVLRKVGTAALAIAVFILAIELLKTGARFVAPLVRDAGLELADPLHALGFGWGLAYVVLSGSPVAATALGLYAGGVLDEVGAYLMIAGSRLGAAFIVLFIGFLYTLSRKHRHHGSLSLQAGVLSLLVTYAIYAPGIALGFVLLQGGWLEPYSIATPPALLGLIDQSFGAVATLVASVAPHPGLVLLAGLGAVLVAFKLFDLALPDIQRRAGRLGRMAERIYRPSVLFAFGFAVTMLTLSVSVSLSLLVPLTVKGVIRRENLIPYIMGANVSTFIDTLAASVIIGGAAAFTVVLAEMVGVAVVSLAVIALGYSHFEEALYKLSHAILASRARMALFLMVILICPLLLMAL